MSIRELISRLYEISAEEAKIGEEACALRSWIVARNPESATHASNLLTYHLIPSINSECRRLRTTIRRLEEKQAMLAPDDEGLASLLAASEERLRNHRASLEHAKENKNG